MILLSVVLSICFAAVTLQSPLGKRASSLRLAVKQNFPDPSFIQDRGTIFAVATNNGKQNVPMATSHDFDNWELMPDYDAMPRVPAWSQGNIWAPDIVRLVSHASTI